MTAELNPHLYPYGYDVLDAVSFARFDVYASYGREDTTCVSCGRSIAPRLNGLSCPSVCSPCRDNAKRGRFTPGTIYPHVSRFMYVLARRSGSNPKTLDAIGRELNVTRERVRQLEQQARKVLASIAGCDAESIA